jgi:hypothetical protein
MDYLKFIDTYIQYLSQKQDWLGAMIGASLGALASLLLGFIVWFVRGIFEYKKASTDLKMQIKGNWYSAEFDPKGNVNHEERNTYLKIKLKRKWGNQVIIKSLKKETLSTTKMYETGWIVKGKLVGETLIGEWYSSVKDSRRFGTVFLKFLEHGRAVGYWVGYSGVTRPVYGYLILSRNLEDLKKISEKVLIEYDFRITDVSHIVENFDNLKLTKKDVTI